VLRSQNLAWQWSIHEPAYRSNTTSRRSRSPSVDAFKIEPCDSEAAFYSRCRMQTSENTSSWRLVE
jgi:hypothetical protein